MPDAVSKLEQAFYNIRGVESVLTNIVSYKTGKAAFFTVAVSGGQFEAKVHNQKHYDEFVDLIDVYCSNAICNKKRGVRVKFTPNNS